MRLEIEYKRPPTPRTTCAFCGVRFVLPIAAVVAYTAEGDRFGDVCGRCMKAGADKMRDRLRVQARRLRQRAVSLTERADRLEAVAVTETIEGLTYAEWQRARQSAHDELRTDLDTLI